MQNLDPGQKGRKLRDYLINFTILLLILAGIANISLSLAHSFHIISDIGVYYRRFSPDNAEIYGMVRRLIGFILIFLSYRLYKRMEMAWYIVTVSLVVSVTLRIIRFHELISPMIFAELFIFAVLFLCAGDFRRKSDATSLRRALLIASGSIVMVVLNSSLSFFALRHEYHGLITFYDAVVQSCRLLFLLDVSSVASTGAGRHFLNATIVFNWICVFSALFYVLKPVIYNPMVRKKDREKIHRLVARYGQNPMAYLALEDDKKYFFGKSAEGVIAFAVVNDVAVVCGDMICAPDDGAVLLSEFMEFCRRNNYAMLFLNVTETFLEIYRLMGFGVTKYGEDACFELSDYNLAGGRVAKVRAAINHAGKAGITISEYQPKQGRDERVEREIEEISESWLKTKKSGELSFMLGGVNLEDPLERRYFVARDSNGVMLGFVVFVPYDGKEGYLADVTRRRGNAPQGVIEKLVYHGFMTLKEEGVRWGNLGLVPLKDVAGGKDKTTLPEKLFEYIYENLNQFYDFKALHHAKEKFAPSHWVPRYIVYQPKRFNLAMAYAIVRVQNPRGLLDYARTFLRGISRKERRK